MPDTPTDDQQHHIRYVLCAPDGTELEEIDEAYAAAFALCCLRGGRGLTLRRDVIRLDSISQVWPKGGV